MPVPNNLPTTKAVLKRVRASYVDAMAARLGHEKQRTDKLVLRRTHGRVTLALAVASAGLGALTFFDLPIAVATLLAAATAVSKAMEPGLAGDSQLEDHSKWAGTLSGHGHALNRMGAEIQEYCRGNRSLNLPELEKELSPIEQDVARAAATLDLSPHNARAESDVGASSIEDARRTIEALLDGDALPDTPTIPPDALPEFARDVVPVARGGVA